MAEFEIILGKGLKNFSFGDGENKIIQAFGMPYDIDNYEYTDNTSSKTLRYKELDISFTLSSEENYRLTDISIYSQKFHIKNKVKIGIEKTKFLELATELDFGEYVFEEYHSIENPTHELISFDKINANFWFDYGKLSSIQVGPQWKDENTIIWAE